MPAAHGNHHGVRWLDCVYFTRDVRLDAAGRQYGDNRDANSQHANSRHPAAPACHEITVFRSIRAHANPPEPGSGGFFVFGVTKMRVLKFGGTSVADAAAIARVVAIVGERRDARTVVVSALAGVTDALLDTARLAAEDPDAALVALETLTARHRVVSATFRSDTARRVLEPALDGIASGAASA